MKRLLTTQGYGRNTTRCIRTEFDFQPAGRRRVEAAFDGGRVSSDGGLLLLRELTKSSGVFRDFAACFRDHRDPSRIEHTVEELLAQRVLGLLCGYEDLNDHDVLRDDALLALAIGKADPTGEQRKRVRDRGHALAGKSTLNRLELAKPTVAGDERYKKISYDDHGIQRLFVDTFLAAHDRPPAEIVLDLDATDDPVHGKQEGRFFHGFYDSYCYLPLYVFCGDFILGAALNTADKQPVSGAVEELERIVSQILARWPAVRIIVRGDSGFCRDEVMRWCEDNGLFFVLGLQKNSRLIAELEDEMKQARAISEQTGKDARVFKDFRYETNRTWSRERRVVGKAEYTTDKENPRFVATNLSHDEYDARSLYEDLYCARGDMENRIKEQQLGLFADRTSAHTLRANQLRLWLSSVAYMILNELRRIALAGTELAHAQVSTIRTRLLKIGAIVTASVRRLRVSLSSVFPLQHVWWRVLENLYRHHVMRR
ncbi:transposase [Nannocystis exedens]|nr:transposase [Nannocystis exedens]